MTTTHPDTLLRMALTSWPLVAPQTLSPSERQWLTQRLTSHAPLTATERVRIVPPLLAALEGYNSRVADVVRAHLAGVEEMPGRGARSTEGLVKILTSVPQLHNAADVAARAALSPSGKRAQHRTTS